MTFMILTQSDTGKRMEPVAGYTEEWRRDEVLDYLRKREPGKTFVKQDPDDCDRTDGRRTT